MPQEFLLTRILKNAKMDEVEVDIEANTEDENEVETVVTMEEEENSETTEMRQPEKATGAKQVNLMETIQGNSAK